MQSDDSLQKQIEELTAQEQRFVNGIRFVVRAAVLGGVLVGLAVPVLVFLDVSGLSLATGIRFVDSMLYSMGGGPLVIVVASVIWAVPGVFAGAAIGCICLAYSAIFRHQ